MSLLRCPVCHQPLVEQAHSCRCASGHSFDRAKEGYLNLLLSHRKKTKQPGDNKEMLLSRRRFLEAGHFDPLVQKMQETIGQYTKANSDIALLDLGCGEGYFLRALQERMPADCTSWGIDVAKPAIQLAAKTDKTGHYAVASNKDLPFIDSAFDVVYSVNAPVFESELVRILKDKGVYIRIAPAGQHLFAMKEIIYTTPKPHENKIIESAAFKHSMREIVDFELTLAAGEAFDLLSMTPYYWHASKEQQQYIKELDKFSSKASFCIDLYYKE